MSKTLDYFKEICAIPHGSYNIDAISEYLVSFAEKRNLCYRRDEAKNVIIFKEASKGYENEPGIIIQGHMDMVAVKTDECKLDMEKEGLILKEENGYLYADGTSLGGDDGIAVAYALEILDDDTILHPALECIFTVNEEVGMDGAMALDMSDIKGTKLINIDSEEEGVITVSCAGGVCLSANLRVKGSVPLYGNVFSIEIKGLKGGHSGTAIHEGRANACILMGQLLKKLSDNGKINLLDISGGEKDNAIPKSAKAFIASDMDEEIFEKTINDFDLEINEKYKGIEETITIVVTPMIYEKEECKLLGDETQTIIEALTSVPDGVIGMCKDIDLVETSLNLGRMRIDENGFRLDFCIRSSVAEEKEKLKESVGTVLAKKGYELALSGDYPGWKYREDSPLRDSFVECYEELYGEKPQVLGVHAGLECGIILSKKENIDAVSVGPNILNIHTTNEKLDLKSVERTRELLFKVIAKRGKSL